MKSNNGIVVSKGTIIPLTARHFCTLIDDIVYFYVIENGLISSIGEAKITDELFLDKLDKNLERNYLKVKEVFKEIKISFFKKKINFYLFIFYLHPD